MWKCDHLWLWVRARNIQRAPCVSPSSPLISAQMSRHSCFFSNQFHAEDQAPALIWTLPLLDFQLEPHSVISPGGQRKWRSVWRFIVFEEEKVRSARTIYSGICLAGLYRTPCTMNAMGIWSVFWLVAFALTSAAPKSHQRLPENTNEQNDTLQVERDNQENILSQVRISSPVLDTIISVQLLYNLQ